MAGATFSVSVGNTTPNGTITEFKLIQEVNKHEIAQITIINAAYSPTLYRSGVPVKVTYGYTPTALNTFYGYINDAKQTIVSNKRNVTLTCVGTSYPLNKKVVRVWGNVSGSYIAKTIALEHKLTPYVQQHPYVFPNYTQTNSTFGTLSWLAESLGYTTYINGTGLFFYDPATPVLDDYIIPSFSFPQEHNLFGSLISFKPSIGQITGAEAMARRMQRQATGIDLFHKSLIGAQSAVQLDVAFNKNYTDTPLFNEFVNQPIDSLGEARQALLSADQVNRFWVTAQAQVWGDPRVRQGGYISISGVDDTHTGLWYVQKATHDIKYTPKTYAKFQYQIEMSLGRDQVDQTSFTIPQEWQNAKKRPPTVFLNGGWRSSFSNDNSLVEC